MGRMNNAEAVAIARRLLAGELSLEDFARQLAAPLISDVGDAQLDLDRARRCGHAEVVFGEGKPVDSLVRIFTSLSAAGIDVLATRIDAEKAAALAMVFPRARYHPVARTWRLPLPTENRVPGSASHAGNVAVITAGTSDRPVAEEAAETARWMGAQVELIQDVGVAGPHRLPAAWPRFQQADAIVVVAGMEAALPSVVGGYVACPVIGVPTSVGYGASLGGITALLSMLTSCASNVTVVNIDAGFKGGYLAGMIACNLARARAARPSS